MPARIYDVVIAGAGPAGSRTARDLARSGFDVCVVEEHSGIGTPCHCSGLISPRTLRLAAVGDDIIQNTIRGAVLHVAGIEPVTVAGGRVHAHVVDRVELDRRLAGQAAQAGATFLTDTRVLGFETTGQSNRALEGDVMVHALRGSVETRIRGRLLIGADGARSRVARQVRGGAQIRDVIIGLGADADYDANPLADHVELFVDAHAAPGWFGWTIPLTAGRARLGTGSANGIKPRESFRRLRTVFPDSFGAARVRRFSGGLIAVWEPSTTVEDRVVLVGDAARQVKPTSGGGIHAALRAATIAARSVERAFHGGDLSRHTLGAYANAWEGTIGRELRRQADIRRALNRLTNPDLAALIGVLDDRHVRSALDRAADIDYPSQLITQLAVRHPQVFWKLFVWPRHPRAWMGGVSTADE